MKFVFDRVTGQMVPENMLFRADSTELEQLVFDWLDKNPKVVISNSWSTRAIASEFFLQNRDIDRTHTDEVRNAIAQWSNSHTDLLHKLEQSSTEDCGAAPAGDCGSALGAQTAGIPQNGTIAAVSCPELHKKKRANEDTDDIPDEYKHGHCYKEAWKAFYDNLSKGPLLCHGIVEGRGPLSGIKYNHAWIEVDGQVIDRTMSFFKKGQPKEVFYALGNIDEKLVFKYDSQQIAKKAVEWGTYGPWEDILWQYP